MARTRIEGMRELQTTIRRLGQLPQKSVTIASRKGAQIALKAAKMNAPEDDGDLKKGIVLKGERSRLKGKKVFQVTFNRNMNEIFAKVSKSGKRSYYPASQEYGFFARNGKYIPGFHYLKKSITENTKAIQKTIVNVLSKEIDKLK